MFGLGAELIQFATRSSPMNTCSPTLPSVGLKLKEFRLIVCRTATEACETELARLLYAVGAARPKGSAWPPTSKGEMVSFCCIEELFHHSFVGGSKDFKVKSHPMRKHRTWGALGQMRCATLVEGS